MTQALYNPLHILRLVRNGRYSCINRVEEDVSPPIASQRQFYDFVIPHKITERGGGSALWVQAPVLLDEIQIQSSSWPKRWKKRQIQLNGRKLSCFPAIRTKKMNRSKEESSYRGSLCGMFSDALPDDGINIFDRYGSTPLKMVELRVGASLRLQDEHTFSIIPCEGEKPWVLRIKDPLICRKWYQACSDCIDILNWIQHYKVGQILGVGGHGIVKVVTDTRTDQQFAMKVVDASKAKSRSTIVKEVEILRDITRFLDHPNLVRIEKVYEEDEKIHIILQYCSGGELYDAIVKRGRYSESDAMEILKQLMSALQALHRHNILHLDIKPENILLEKSVSDDEVPKIVLTDFGLAQTMSSTLEDDNSCAGISGTVGYIAPEVITSRLYTPAADIFSAGVILFILLVGYPPFYGQSDIETMLMTARGEYCLREEDWNEVSTQARDLVTRMLTTQVQDRITLSEILEHPWMQRHKSPRQDPLTNAANKMEQYNCVRKSTRAESSQRSFSESPSTSLNFEMVQDMFEQIAFDGKIRIENAHRLVLGFGFSPFVNQELVVQFLDHDKDGYISACDYWRSLEAIRSNDASFAFIIFDAFLAIRKYLFDTSNSDVGFPDVLRTLSGKMYKDKLTQADFIFAFRLLDCPEDLYLEFFQYCRMHIYERKASEQGRINKMEQDSYGARTASMSSEASVASVSSGDGGLSCENVGFCMKRETFSSVFGRFPFLRMLFLGKCSV